MTSFWAPSFEAKAVRIITEKKAFSGYSQVVQFQLQFPLFGGGMSHTVPREVVCRNEAVAVLLFDPLKNKVVLIEQFRIGAMVIGKNPWLLEIVAGKVETGDSVVETAYREVSEETGCTVLSLISICEYLVSPGVSAEKISIYCAKVDAPDVGGHYGLVEEGEDIKVWVLDIAAVFQLLDEGKIMSSHAVIALQWLKLNHASLHFPTENP